MVRKKNGEIAARQDVAAGTSSAAQPREQIIRRARQLFLKSGFRSVTMDEVAASMGMSKKTLYQSFSGKDELLRAVIQQKFDEIESALEAILTQDLPVHILLANGLETLQREISEVQPAFVRDVQRSDPALYQSIHERRVRIIRQYFGQLMERGVREGAVRGDVPVAIMIEVLLGAIQELITPARLAYYNISPQQAFEQVIGIFLHGILMRPEGGAP